VPFFPDNTDQCGPSVLASVLNFWKTPAEPGALKNEIYRGNLKGSLPIDLLLAAQAHGMSAEILDQGLPQLKRELDAGHPLIVFVNQGFEFLPIGHYMVVTGYDDGRREIYAHSGTHRNGPVPYGKFLKQWVRTDQWTLLILPLAR
jgi:ABC-type bacteriocin/lantibiotic exporter with double-glycine peptidase domain